MSPVPQTSSLGFVEGVAQPLEKRFEVIKEVGDGSFGSVVLARVRGTRNMVAVKSMKKSFDSFSECLRLREVQSLRAIPRHPHIVPVLDAFLDPTTHKLHLVMELMEINLYQFLKSRENKPLEPRGVQVILWQVCSALQHIHAHGFFHRDIKPENVLLSIQPPKPSSSSRFVYTPPQTPPSKQPPSAYIVKLADFGLAREIRSRPPYTSYVSTRWYRAPEVLLRAEEYSAPVDIWAMGAMAIEVATLRPIFPGTNEIDQLWRVCEVMGTPADWYGTEERTGRKVKVGGGPWPQGVRLAEQLQFKFPKVQPIEMGTILSSPWPKSLSDFVVACLYWDPKRRPTSLQCINHEYFRDVERYLPQREHMPTPPATMNALVKPIDIPQRGARPQASLSPLASQTTFQQNELQHHASQPQLTTQKSGWFNRGRDKKRDSSIGLAPPQLPAINVAPSLPPIAPKITIPAGMAFISPNATKPQPQQPEQRSPYHPPPKQHTFVEPHPPPAPPKVGISHRGSWNHPIQVPGQHGKGADLSLPTIRPVSPIHNQLFPGDHHVPRKPLKLEEAPKPEKSPIRVPVVNTFALQAAALEAQSTQTSLATQSPTKVGRQLSSTSTDVASPFPSPNELPTGEQGKAGFFSHFRKKARKRMSMTEDSLEPSSATSPVAPISPIPQLRPIDLGGETSLRNSIVMEDFFEDAREEIESRDLMKQFDEALAAAAAGNTAKPTHITIAPAPIRGAISSHPPSSHKLGLAIPPSHTSALAAKSTRHLPSPYPSNPEPPTTTALPPLNIPKRGSSRKVNPDSSSESSSFPRSRRTNANPSPLPRILDDVPSQITIPGAYPLSSSPESLLFPERRPSLPLSRSTNLSVNLPGAYPREKNRYNSSSSGLSSAASYRTALDSEMWDSEDAKARDEQAALQQSLMDATRAMRALEKYSVTDWTEQTRSGRQKEEDVAAHSWPTPPYIEDSVGGEGKKAKTNDYYRFGIPSPQQ